MKLIHKSRRMGKTHDLIKLADGEPVYIVCATRNHCATVSEQAHKMGCRINYPLTFDEFLQGDYFGRNISEFLIDDADELLQFLSRGVTVSIASFNKVEDETGGEG